MKIYNKLVRDKIPEIISNDNRVAITRILDDGEYLNEINKKLQEEVKEYLEDNNVEELADIVEVIYGILNCKNVSIEQFEEIRKGKVDKRGAFDKKIFLESVHERMNKEELIKLIDSLKLDKNEYWILSSAALVIRGIYPDAGDLDIAVTEKGLEELKHNYNLKEDNGRYIINDRIECILDTKEPWKIEKYGEYNLQSIEKYYDFLKKSSRPKDKARIKLIEEYIKNE